MDPSSPLVSGTHAPGRWENPSGGASADRSSHAELPTGDLSLERTRLPVEQGPGTVDRFALILPASDRTDNEPSRTGQQSRQEDRAIRGKLDRAAADFENPTNTSDLFLGKIESLETLRVVDGLINQSHYEPCFVLATVVNGKEVSPLQTIYALDRMERLSDDDLRRAGSRSLAVLMTFAMSLESARGDAFGERIFKVLSSEARSEILAMFPPTRKLDGFNHDMRETIGCTSPSQVLELFRGEVLPGTRAVSPGPLDPEFVAMLAKFPVEVQVNRTSSGFYVFTKGTKTTVISDPHLFSDLLPDNLHNHPIPGWVLPSGLDVHPDRFATPSGGDLAATPTTGTRFIVSETGLTAFELDLSASDATRTGKARLTTVDGKTHEIEPDETGNFSDKILQPFLDSSFEVTGGVSSFNYPIKVTYVPWSELNAGSRLYESFRSFCSASGVEPDQFPCNRAHEDSLLFDRLATMADAAADRLPADKVSEVKAIITTAHSLRDESLMTEVVFRVVAAGQPEALQSLVSVLAQGGASSAVCEAAAKNLDLVIETCGVRAATQLALAILPRCSSFCRRAIERSLTDASYPPDARMELVEALRNQVGFEQTILELVSSEGIQKEYAYSFFRDLIGDERSMMTFNRGASKSDPFAAVNVWGAILESSLDPEQRLKLIIAGCTNLPEHRLKSLSNALADFGDGALPTGWRATLAEMTRTNGKTSLAESIEAIPFRPPRVVSHPDSFALTSSATLSFSNYSNADVFGSLEDQARHMLAAAGKNFMELQTSGLIQGPPPIGSSILRACSVGLFGGILRHCSARLAAIASDKSPKSA